MLIGPNPCVIMALQTTSEVFLVRVVTSKVPTYQPRDRWFIGCVVVLIEFHVIRTDVPLCGPPHLIHSAPHPFCIQVVLPPISVVPANDHPHIVTAIHSLFVRL